MPKKHKPLANKINTGYKEIRENVKNEDPGELNPRSSTYTQGGRLIDTDFQDSGMITRLVFRR